MWRRHSCLQRRDSSRRSLWYRKAGRSCWYDYRARSRDLRIQSLVSSTDILGAPGILITSTEPFRTNRGFADLGSISILPSRYSMLNRDPGLRPAASRMDLGIATRPARSMVAVTPLVSHNNGIFPPLPPPSYPP